MSHKSLLPAPSRYTTLTANASPSTKLRTSLVYDAICKVLSERGEQVDWGGFSAAEWGILPRMAQTEGIGPLLYWHFKNNNWPPGIPKGVADALMGQYYSTMGQNTLLFRELDRILAALAEANIPVILLKGTALP